MNTTSFIVAAAILALGGCKQRQHISLANIAVVQKALAEANAADTHFVHLKLTPAGKAMEMRAPDTKPSPARGMGADAVVTAKEVESVLGPPHEVYPPETALRDVEVFRYYYFQDKDLYEFNFHDGRLIEINLMPPGSSAKKS